MGMDSQERAFLLLLIGSAVAMLVVLSPFLYVFVLAAVTASVAWPMHRRLSQACGGRRWASAVVLMLMVSTLVLVPASFLALRVVAEGARGIEGLLWELSDGAAEGWVGGFEVGYNLARDEVLGELLPPVDELEDRFVEALRTSVLSVTLSVPAGVSGLVSWLWRRSMDVTAFLVALYMALTRGPELLDALRRIAPLRDVYVVRLYEVFRQLAMNIVVGMIGAGVAQGVVAGLGFALAGVPAAVALGAVTAVTSMVPVVGSMVVWVPVAAGLVASGRVGAGAFVVVWSLAITASADNVVKPILLKNQLKVSPLWMLLALFGGMLTMGVQGLVFGPLLLVLYLTLYTIYLRDFVGEAEG
jgi:predicted PurR-regulated permease PerM